MVRTLKLRCVRTERWYYFMNQGLQNQDVLYTSDSHEMTADSKIFLDPNTLSSDGTTALGGMSFTDAGAQLR